MDGRRSVDLTTLIEASSAGDRQAQIELFTIVHDELRRIARRCCYVGAPGETLQATALVNEAYIELSRRMARARPESASVRAAFYTIGCGKARRIHAQRGPTKEDLHAAGVVDERRATTAQ